MPVTVAVPAATPVKVTVQLPEVKLQLAPTVPTAVLDDVKLTLPVGVFEAVVLSVMVAVQVEVAPTLMVLGAQTTAVDVLSLAVTPIVIVAAALVLPLWLESPS